MECVRQKRYPVNPEEYKLYEEIGEGVSATVYRALCIPFNEIVAIKVLDLEKCNNDFDGIRREVQTMTLIKHPNVLRAHCSFTADRSLWVVMPYMAGGSCLHIMKSAHPEGFEEPVIVTLLREVLKALVYLHKEGHIHRDVKAGNILIDSDGAVKLADFGVSACMFDTGDRQRSRNTFVGTPCWMAPEVMQQLHGYDFKADVWSFGITALELAHGHAPFSKYPPMKVLLMTLQNAPPGLDYERDKRFSKSFKQMVGMCLVKDPKRRPTSEKLLKHSFFKGARSNEYLRRNILEGLAPLGDRFRKLKDKEADFLLENKVMSENKEHLSHQEYIRGISAWNFNLEDLKAQAALLDDNAEFSPREDLEMNNKSKNEFSNVDCKSDALHSKSVDNAVHATKEEDELLKIRSFEDSLASSFPTRPLLALNGYFDVYEDDTSTGSPEWKDATQSSSEPQQQLPQKEDLPSSDSHLNSESSFAQRSSPHGQQKFLSGSLLPERVLSPSGNASANGNRNGLRHSQSERNYSGPLVSRQIRETHHQQSTMMKDEASEERVIHKGRFKVTSADACPKGVPSTNISKPPPGAASTAKLALSSVLPSLQFILQQNAMQREQLTKLIQCVEQTSGRQSEYVDLGAGDTIQFSPASDRERELLANVVQLQQGISSLSEEIQRLRIQNAQIQRQLDDASNTES